MKGVIILLCVIGLSYCTYAQSYDTVVGVRAGIPAGLNAKKLIFGGIFGLEGIVGVDYDRNTNLCMLMEYQFYLNRNTNWYAGLGGTMIFGKNNVGLGLDPVVGAEVTFDNYPINVALDWKPTYLIFERRLAWYQVAVSVRYIL